MKLRCLDLWFVMINCLGLLPVATLLESATPHIILITRFNLWSKKYLHLALLD